MSNKRNQPNNHYRGDSSGLGFISLLSGAISSGTIGLLASPKRLGTSLAIFTVAFSVAFFTSSLFTPLQNSDATQQVSLTFDDSDYYATVSASGTVNLDLIGTREGATAIASDTVTVTTNSTTGYKLYISSDSTSESSTRLNLAGNLTATSYFSPVSGTLDAPTLLDDNSWGYTTTDVTGNTTSITSSSYFLGLPLLYDENLLDSYGSAVTSGRSIDVYYGVKANTALPAGTYSSKVVYTIVAEGNPAADGTIALDKSVTTPLTGGDTITISTGLYTSTDNIGSGTDAPTVTIGGDSCTNVTTSITTTGAIKLTCTTPAKDLVGYNDVVVNIPKFNKTYTLDDGLLYYVPWNSMTKMQEMTDYACGQATIATSTNSADYDRSTNYSYQRILTDTRDSNTYIVRRLPDGNCWMTENLRLAFKDGKAVDWNDSTKLTTLTSHNSDFTTIESWDGGGHTSETSTNHTTWPSLTPMSYSSGTARVQQDYGDSNQLMGNFYNLSAASAGMNYTDEYLDNSVCPKGWQLPFHTQEDKSWYQLVYAAKLTSDSTTEWAEAITTAPYSLIHQSRYSGNNPNANMGTGYYCSTNPTGGGLNYNISNMCPNCKNGTQYGFSVRCVSR